jgi:stage II sporulation protein D
MPGRRRSPALLAMAVLGFGLASAAQGAELVLVRGGGSGNGAGMSQWGAEGYALHGWDYRQILGHYYPHTAVMRVPDVPIRVLLLEGRSDVSISSKAPYLLIDARGRRFHVPAGAVDLGARPRIHGVALRLAVTAYAGAQPLAVDGRAYRGTLTIARSADGLSVENTVPLERYVRSVVASELPDGWQPAAYRAQAVAARSYAVAGIRPAAPFDVYGDPRSQNYAGIAAETRAADQATAQTAGQTLAYYDRVISALYDSSSGGQTAAVQDAFPGANPEPYLVSVSDPYDSISPYHHWQVTLSGEQLEARVGFAVNRIRVQHDGSGLASAVLVDSQGALRTLTGTSFAGALGLRSRRFSLALVTLGQPIRIGKAKVRLTGVEQGIDGAVIQRRQANGTWTQVAHVRPDALGRFSTIVRWVPSGVYRIAVDQVAGPPVTE